MTKNTESSNETQNSELGISDVISNFLNIPIVGGRLLTFDEWYDLNEEAISIEFAESGADRELDFDIEREFEKRYKIYLDNAH